jgi:hypothetical protein
VTPALHAGVSRIVAATASRVRFTENGHTRTDNLTIADYVTEAKVQIKKAGVIPGPLLNPAP